MENIPYCPKKFNVKKKFWSHPRLSISLIFLSKWQSVMEHIPVLWRKSNLQISFHYSLFITACYMLSEERKEWKEKWLDKVPSQEQWHTPRDSDLFWPQEPSLSLKVEMSQFIRHASLLKTSQLWKCAYQQFCCSFVGARAWQDIRGCIVAPW